MFRLLSGLIVFGIVITLVVLIGHGLWLIAAALWKSLFGGSPVSPLHGERCAACGHPRGLKDGVCQVCGHRTAQTRLIDLKTAFQQMVQLRDRGQISDAVHAEVTAALARCRTEILSQMNVSDAVQSASTALREPGPASSPAPSGVPGVRPQPPVDSTTPSPFAQPPISMPLDAEVLDAEVVDAEPVTRAAGAPAAVPSATAASAWRAGAEEAAATPAAARFSPRRTFADMLQAFMEEKNIRWGELASGILIVGSAIGLVISLRATLEQLSERIPYFPALLFMLGTVAIHGAGLYTLRRWNLRSTSRGVLIIATLLVPLSFASGILLSGQIPVTHPIYAVAVAIGLLGYGGITALSARALFAEGWWRLVVAVTGTAVGQLIVHRLAGTETRWPPLLAATALFAVPLASYLVPTLSQLRQVARRRYLTSARAGQTFTVLGVSVFALVVPLGLMARGDSIRETLCVLSPSLSVAMSVVLGIGIAVQWRSQSRSMAEIRTAGTALAILGGLLMLGTLVLAWPVPGVLIAVGAVTAVVLAAVAVVGRLPILYAGTIAAATFTYLLVFHYLLGQFEPPGSTRGRDLVAALLMGRSAVALLVPAAAVCLSGAWLMSRRRQPEGSLFVVSGGSIAVISVLIAGYAGFWSRVDAAWMTPVLTVYAAAALIAAASMRRSALTWIGTGLLFVALVHLTGWNEWFLARLEQWRLPLSSPLLAGVICHGLVVELLAIAVWARARRRGGRDGSDDPAIRRTLLGPLCLSGVLTAAGAVPFVLPAGRAVLGSHAAYAAAIAVTWLMAGCVHRWRELVVTFQMAMTVAISFAVAAFAVRQPWLESVWNDLRHWQLQVSVLGLWCAASVAARLLLRRWPAYEWLSRPRSISVDAVLLATLIGALLLIGVMGCWPGTLAELGLTSPDSRLATSSWHTYGFGTGSWIALTCLGLALVLTVVERTTTAVMAGLCVLAATVPLLLAGRFESQLAVASALRWSFSIYCAAWVAVFAARGQIAGWASRILPTSVLPDGFRAVVIRDLAMALGMVPVVFLTMWAVLLMAGGATLGGPHQDAFLAGHPRALYGMPLGILVLCALGAAVRDREPALSLLGSLLLQFFIGLMVLLPDLGTPAGQSSEVRVLLAQWIGCGLAGYTLAWLALSRWIEPRGTAVGSWLLRLQMWLATATVVLLAVWVLVLIFPKPAAVGVEATLLGRWPSYLAAGLLLGVLIGHYRPDRWPQTLLPMAIACVLTTLAAATANAFDPGGSWLSYHVLTAGYLVIGLAGAGWACWRTAVADGRAWIQELAAWAVGIAVVTGVLIVRGCLAPGDPWNPWWTAGTCAGEFVLFSALALRGRNQWLSYVSLLVVLFATTILWDALHGASSGWAGIDLIYCNVFSASLVGFLWLWVEVWYQSRRNQSFDLRIPLPPVHSAVACAGSAVLLLVVLGGTTISTLAAFGSPGGGFLVGSPWGIAATVGFGGFLVSMLWDRRTLLVTIALYAWGLVGIAMVLNSIERTSGWGPDGTVVGGCLAGAAYVALTGHLWKCGANLAQWAVRLHMPRPIATLEHTSYWLPSFNTIATLGITFLGFVTVLTSDVRGMRMGAAFAPLLLAYGLACLAQQRRRFPMQCFSLGTACLAAVFMGWADVRPVVPHSAVLAYVSRLLIVVAGVTLLYGLVVARWLGPRSGWYEAVRKTSVALAATTLCVLIVALVLEVAAFEPGVGAPIATPEVIVISIMLLGFVAALLSMALLPGRDPLSLSEKGRTVYVYVAQGVAALLFAHIYLAKPELFTGRLRPYWPYLVMLLAFGSVAFAEICYRRNWRVIAEPMHRTGGLLPLLPALGAWAFSDTSYPLVLFFAGLIYVFVSITRRSFVAAIAAAVLGNGALWALLTDQGFRLLAQPQFWLVPPAVSVLAAAHVNRHRLSAGTLTAIRYMCVVIIYLSSAGEMFLVMMMPAGAEGWLRPIILASLSVAGIFVGIVLRVRAFLYLGISFLLLSTVGMVWHAARLVGHVWPWWVFGISLGLLILIVFGLFEKYRREIQRYISRLRAWEP